MTQFHVPQETTTFLYRAPKKNHDAITQNLKKFIPWFENNGVRIEYYQFAVRETQEEVDSAKASGMEGMESIAKTLAAEDIHGWSYNILEITTTVKKCTQR
jgi:hypothetical protein